ncbi:MAG: 50S ribosomal protein L24 [Candidatus Micrarchaeota archaeon]
MKFEKSLTFQPRKKRKALYARKVHLVKRLLRIHLSKELRKTYKKRALLAKKGDKVKIITGEHKKKEGRIIEVDTKNARIFIEGIIQKKQGGKEKFFPMQPSNCILIEWAQPRRKEMRQKTSIARAPSQIKPAPATSQKPIVAASAQNPNKQNAPITSAIGAPEKSTAASATQ